MARCGVCNLESHLMAKSSDSENQQIHTKKVVQREGNYMAPKEKYIKPQMLVIFILPSTHN